MIARIREVAASVPPTGDLAADTERLFRHYGREITREHLPRAAAEAKKLALRFGVGAEQAEVAALLHDIGGVFRRSEMVELCESLGLVVEPEERQVPLLLHAKLSVVLAQVWQNITDAAVLQAVRYHTTLHAQATPLDQVVFLADKLEWDQGGIPPYHAELSAALDSGLEAGTRWMLGWMATPQAKLLIPHPDLRSAWAAYGISPAETDR